MPSPEIRLRPLRMEDALVSVAWRNDPGVRDFLLSHRLPVAAEMEERWVRAVIEDQSRERVVLAVTTVDDTLVGYGYLQGIDWIDRTAEVAIVVGSPDWQGRGFGREAVSALIEMAFGTLGLERVFARVAEYNQRALGLFKGQGFKPEGVLRSHVFRLGARHDVHLLGLMRSDRP